MSIEPVVKPRAGNRKIVLTSYVLKKGFHIIFSTPDQACCEGCCGNCCRGCYNWPTTLTFRIIWLLGDVSYFSMNAVQANYSKYNKDRYCPGSGSYWDEYYCDKYTRYFGFDITCTLLFLAASGIGIGMIVAFSKFPKNCCCGYNNTYPTQTVVVGGQPQPMQTVQRMPNGQLMVIQNPNVGISNPNYVIAQQPQTI